MPISTMGQELEFIILTLGQRKYCYTINHHSNVKFDGSSNGIGHGPGAQNVIFNCTQ
jgi:hypothetical protein